MKAPISVVWLKRDLRLHDHAALQAAIAEGLPILLLYVFEPSLRKAETYDTRHACFVWESLEDLHKQLAPFQGQIQVVEGEVLELFQKLQTYFDIHGIYAHQETGIFLTYQRDILVETYLKAQRIPLHTFPQDGVERGRMNREGWEEDWKKYMSAPPANIRVEEISFAQLPQALSETFWPMDYVPSWYQKHTASQPGGSSLGSRYLQSFLQKRIRDYASRLSYPIESRRSCSRLSPYIAYGNLSVRQIYQATQTQRETGLFATNLARYQERLWWRSHYMQKLETDYEIEWKDINPGFQLLARQADAEKLERWAKGLTGFPMVDACMRCLRTTGFLNFRMRAMLSTFATFSLWLPWQDVAKVLAKIFLDFEPGIHFAQIQMQAGTSGYHPLRVYNPMTQAERLDPQGVFVKQWIPELADVPAPQIIRPWRMTPMEQMFFGCEIGKDYPVPIVNYDTETQKAKDVYWRIRRDEAVRQHLPQLWWKHCLPRNRKEYEMELAEGKI
ncbi:MAG: FAD-binding domain-containing protein [Bacteroidota bacterium]